MKACQLHIWAALAFLVVAPGHVLGQSSTDSGQSSIDSRVQKLEETIQVLERQVDSLEAQLRERNVTVQADPAKVNWRKLQNGMSESDVKQLLGSPSKIDANEVIITWFYGYPLGGRVEFDGNSHTVEGWTEP